MDEQLNPSLTRADIEAQEREKLAEKYGDAFPAGLAEAIAQEELLMETKSLLRKVPEYIFKRDILPAVAGKLGPVDMRWWIKQFGSVTLGFLVVKDSNHDEVIFEFPPMAPSNQAELNSDKRPVGDVIKDYHNRAQIRPSESKDELKKALRDYIHPGDQVVFIDNIARVERICRYYGETILAEAKPEFRVIIDAAIGGLNEVYGKLGEETSTVKTPDQNDQVKEESQDDDGEATQELYD